MKASRNNNMFNRIRNIVGSLVSGNKATPVGRQGVLLGERLADIPLSRLADYGSYLEAGTSKLWASWKACDITAEAVKETPFKLINQQTKKEAHHPDLSRLLISPNDFETWKELEYQTVMHLKYTGNAFWYKSDANISGDRPSEIFWLNPKRVKIVPSRDNKIKGYIYSVNGKDIAFDMVEIMHFKRPHPNNEFWGLGDFEAGETILNDSINHSKWGETVWKNGAAPSGVMVSEEGAKNQKDWEVLKAKWKKDYSGDGNTGKMAWLTGKWQYIQLGMNAADLQDLEKKRASTEDLFTLHGVPLSVAGIKDAANFATARVDDIRFRRYTVKPLVTILQDTINTNLIAGFSPVLKLVFNVTGLLNTTELVTDYSPVFDRGIISPNEFREIIGLEPVDDPIFDGHYVNAGLVPIELAGVGVNTVQPQAQQIIKRFIGSGDDAIKQALAPA